MFNYMLRVAIQHHLGPTRSSLVAQKVKDLPLTLQITSVVRLLTEPWPRKFHMSWIWRKKKNEKRKTKTEKKDK